MSEWPELLKLLPEISNYVKLAVLASQRLLAAMMVIPFVSQGSMPGLPRHAMVVVLTPFLVPLLPPDIFKSNPGWLFFLSLALREVAIGIFMGMVIAVPLIILEGVGHALDFQSGLSNASVYDPATHEETGPFGRMFSQVAVWLLFGPVGILSVVTVLMFSFELWPLASPGPFGAEFGYRTAIESTNALLRAILMLAAPALVALVLVELSLGLIGRFAQQLDVNASAMPLKTLVAAGAAALMLSYVLDMVREERSWSDRALHFMRDATTKPTP
ncbi:MAG: type secretion protein [Pseudomonadota bacterium]|jgi:type III secretion protein T